MQSDIAEAFDLSNLHRAWRWTLTNTASLYKNHFRQIYEAYSVADDKLLDDLRQRLKRGIYEPTDSCKIYLPKKSGILRPDNDITRKRSAIYMQGRGTGFFTGSGRRAIENLVMLLEKRTIRDLSTEHSLILRHVMTVSTTMF